MLARIYRITKKEDFEAAYRRGKSFSFDMITMAARNNGSDTTRFGVVVSAKFSKKAVERNRIKRQIREIVRKNEKRVRPGYDIVLGVRKVNGATSYKTQQIEDTIEKLWNIAKLINEKKK